MDWIDRERIGAFTSGRLGEYGIDVGMATHGWPGAEDGLTSRGLARRARCGLD